MAAGGDEFAYHPMPVLVPVAFVLAVVGLTGLMGLMGVLVALIALPLSVWAIVKVARSEGFYSGGTLAKLALGLSLVGLIGGSLVQRHRYQTEVPEGFERISFNYDVSKQPIGQAAFGGTEVSERIQALEGQPVFLKGYMYPTRQTQGLTSFLLLKDTGECCFGGDPAVTDMIGIKMQGDLTADHHELQRVAIAGKFRVNRNYGSSANDGSPEPLYLIDAEHFEVAQTAF